MFFPRVILKLIGDFCGGKNGKYSYKLVMVNLQKNDRFVIKVARTDKKGKVVRKVMTAGDVYLPPTVSESWNVIRWQFMTLEWALKMLEDFERTNKFHDRYFYHRFRVRLDNIALEHEPLRELVACDREKQIAMVEVVNKLDQGTWQDISLLLTDASYSQEFMNQMEDPEFFQMWYNKIKSYVVYLKSTKESFVTNYRFNAFSLW